MLIVMLRPRRLQEAGAERMLSVGVEYDLAPLVAQSLVATGAARFVEDEASLETAGLAPPEIKPDFPPETKRTGSRRPA